MPPAFKDVQLGNQMFFAINETILHRGKICQPWCSKSFSTKCDPIEYQLKCHCGTVASSENLFASSKSCLKLITSQIKKKIHQ
jgi:hypothetical protein